MSASLPLRDDAMIAALEAPDADRPDYQLALAEQRRILRWAVSVLQGRHARLIALRYENDMTFGGIGKVFAVSESAACAMHGRILDRLRAALADQGIRSLKDL